MEHRSNETTPLFLILSVYSDGDRGHVFEDINDLPPAPMPTCLFNDAPPTIQEIMNVIRKSRNGSAPGPSGILYVVYKNLPSLVAVLLGVCLKRCGSPRKYHYPGEWQV